MAALRLGERLVNFMAVNVVRPYAVHELPGWGRLLWLFVDRRGDEPWRGTLKWSRGKLHGYEMLLDLGSWTSRGTYFTGRYYDLATQHLIQLLLRPGDVFVDIGANEGMMSLLASRIVGSSGAVVAFEPNPTPRSFLERAIERNGITNIRVEPYGVSDEPAILPLYVPMINSGEGSFGNPGPAMDEGYTIHCEVKRADPVLSSYVPALIKIDVEGFEMNALRGIQESLSLHRPPVVMELIGRHLRRARTTVEEIREFMSLLDYRAQRIAWSRRKGVLLSPVDFSEEMELDVIWTRKQ